MDDINSCDLSDLLGESATENAAPADPRNGAEDAAAGKSYLANNSAASPIEQDWAEICAARLWVAWREEARNGKPTKVPYSAPDRMAKANDPQTWVSRSRAESVARELLHGGMRGGVGLMLGRGIGGVDLDSCYDASTRKLEPWAAEVVERFASYAEISPSGSGVKVFFRYASDDLEPLRAIMSAQHGKSWSRGSHCEIALHLGNRYFAFTGQELPAAPADMRPVERGTLQWLIEDAGPRFKGTLSLKAVKDESRSGRAFKLAS